MDPRTLERIRRLVVRFLTAGGNQVAVAVTAAATSVSITFPRSEPDVSYGVVATPDWDTTTYVTSKTTSGCTINFGTAAPGGGGAVDLVTFRTE